jgi:hypothetical protein
MLGSTSLVKMVMVFGLVASLVGGIATSPVAVKADASVKVTIQAKASLDVRSGKAKARTKAQAKKAAKSKRIAATTTAATTTKGKGTMKTTSINVYKKNVGKKASSHLGE